MPTMIGDLSKKILPVREQHRVQEQWLKDRLHNLLPNLMKETGLDMWIVMTDEYNADPVTKTLLPPTLQDPRGKMILVFTLLPDETVEAETVSRPSGIEHIYTNSWYGIRSTDWKGKQITPPKNTALAYVCQLVEQHKPKSIGINVDDEHPYCDGLSHSNYKALTKALGPWAERLVSAAPLATRWMETRSADEMATYDGIVQLAHGIIAQCFTSNVVTPGVTTVDDVRYELLQRIMDLGIQPSFEPSCAVFRKGDPGMHNEGYVIQPGDILHCDVGISYLGLCTDTQQLAYILRPGEEVPPQDLQHALKVANRLQDIVCGNIETGKTGNDVLVASRQQAEKEGIVPCIYSHPLGVFAHAPGPSIGRFGNQNPASHGEMKFYPHTVYSLELNATVEIPCWNNEKLMTCVETDIYFDGNHVYYLAERQTAFICIR